MSEDIIIHEKQSTLEDFDYDFKLSLEEFKNKCFPVGQGYDVQSAEWKLYPVNIAVIDGVRHSFKTVNNEVLFTRI